MVFKGGRNIGNRTVVDDRCARSFIALGNAADCVTTDGATGAGPSILLGEAMLKLLISSPLNPLSFPISARKDKPARPFSQKALPITPMVATHIRFEVRRRIFHRDFIDSTARYSRSRAGKMIAAVPGRSVRSKKLFVRVGRPSAMSAIDPSAIARRHRPAERIDLKLQRSKARGSRPTHNFTKL